VSLAEVLLALVLGPGALLVMMTVAGLVFDDDPWSWLR
jgi:hypothetical protein